jgi:FkbM family methyltransferase
LLPAGALCFDVGANIGSKSEALLLAGARVVAFEPNLRVLPELIARCGHDDKWSLVAAAVGSAAKIATLYDRKCDFQSSLAPNWEGEIIATQPTVVVTLDSAITTFGVPFYCKIDVEGGELEVLQGLSKVIPLISFEYHCTDADLAKTRACLDRLSPFGSAQVNFSLGESPSFQLQEWISINEFIHQHLDQMSERHPDCSYGDIWVRS